MAGHLMLLFLIFLSTDTSHDVKIKALIPPTLTVNPAVIKETESLTLNCQTPVSVSMSECYFYFVNSGDGRYFSCVKTLTGTELLDIVKLRSPVEVKVKCAYNLMEGEKHFALHSDTSSITINSPLPPTLTVNPAVITETDSVTLNCQTPVSVSMSECYFYFMNSGNGRYFSCVKTLTGTELLDMVKLRSPVEVKVTCSYVLCEEPKTLAPHSDTSSITIYSPLPPTLTVNPAVITETDSVTLNCQTPVPVSMSECYFYFVNSGDGRYFSCVKTLTGTELLDMVKLRSPVEVKVTCSYVLCEEPKTLAPHSDTSSITIYSPLPPTLTVNPAVITETDSVTLNCQTPVSVSMSECYFYFVNSGNGRYFSCVKTLTGTELLDMVKLRSPVEVKVTCSYITKEGEGRLAPYSDKLSIIINSPPPPTLTVNPAVITETDSVTLNCQTPVPVSMSKCYFYFVNSGDGRYFSCVKTLTGTELLDIAKLRSPVEVKVTCSYVLCEEPKTLAPHSDTSSITIYSPLPPTLTVNPAVITETDSVTLNCQTPVPVSMSECYFYFVNSGDGRYFSCVKTLTGTELLDMVKLRSPVEVKVTCSYITKEGEGRLAPYSDKLSIIINKEEEDVTTTIQTTTSYVINNSLGVNKSGADDVSLPVTSMNKKILWISVVAAGSGVAIGAILMCSAFFKTHKRAAPTVEVKERNLQRQPSCTYYHSSTTSTEPYAPEHSEEVKRRDFECQDQHSTDIYYYYTDPEELEDSPGHTEDLRNFERQNSTYHIYSSIYKKPAKPGMAYNTLMPH